jgi:hypothetical protein
VNRKRIGSGAVIASQPFGINQARYAFTNMLSVFTIRDFLWSVLVAFFALCWQLDGQVKELQVSDSQDAVKLFREDNATLERELTKHRARLELLEARVVTKDTANGY